MSRAFSGKIEIQLLRAMAYSIFSILLLLGIIFAAYLLYVPFVDLFIWTWDTTDTPLYTYLLPLSLILPASALLRKFRFWLGIIH